MSADLLGQAGMETMGLNGIPLTICINEDALAAVEHQLDVLERRIVQVGATAFWREPDAELLRQTA
jgi:hypothetical protein